MPDLMSPFARVAAIAAVLVVALTLLVSRGPVDALLLIGVVTGLAGLYKMRSCARARLLYHRHRDQEPRQPDLARDSASSRTH
jgi:hypothetical protein